MGALLSTLLPMCVVAAVSPMMLTEQSVVLGTGGRRSAAAYAAGTAVVLAGISVALLLLGASLELPTAPHLTAGSDIALGILLVVGTVLLSRRPPRAPRPPRFHATAPAPAFGFGVFSMATNFTTLAVVVTALKDVSASGVGMAGVGLALAFVLFFGCLPAWLPIAVATASPRHGRAALREFGTLVTRHGRTIGLSLTAVVGGYLVVRGMVGLG